MKFILLSILSALCFGCWETWNRKTEKKPQENITLQQCESARNKMLETEATYEKTKEEYYRASAIKNLAKEEHESASSNTDQAWENCRKAQKAERQFVLDSHSIFAGVLNPKTSERIRICNEYNTLVEQGNKTLDKYQMAEVEYDKAFYNKAQAEEEYNKASANKDQVCP